MATKAEVIDMIERLESHCRPPLMAVDARAGWMRDWCDDLASYSVEQISAAARAWRSGTSAKFPTFGQFKALIPSQRRAETVATSEPWRELNDAEYGALDLWNKIRHRQLLAMSCRNKALSALTATGSRDRSNMPSEGKEWLRLAANHEAEAKRLREHLKTAPVAA